MTNSSEAQKLKDLENLLSQDNKSLPPWQGTNGVFFNLEKLILNPFAPRRTFLTINRSPLSANITLEQETPLDVGVFYALINLGMVIGQVFIFPANSYVISTPYAVGATLHKHECQMNLFWRNAYLSVITGPGRVLATSHHFRHYKGTYISEMIATRKNSNE